MPEPSAHPFDALADHVPAVLFVCENGRPVHVSAAARDLLGEEPERYVREPWLWDRDRSSLFEVSKTVDEDGTQRTYGALVAADPARDPITRLPGPGLLREHLRLAVARARSSDARVAVLQLGCEGLDLVSAGLGRAAHEQVLAELGERVREALPDTALVATLGDGQLAVMLADLDGSAEQAAETAAGQLIVATGRPLQAEDEEFELLPRVGVSLLPGDAADAEALMRHAGSALRQARRSDGPRVLFYDGGTSEALERLLITSRLRRALEHEELVLHFQPIFRLPGGEIAGVEALLRWEDPDRGTIAPLDFIPVAEQTGLIEPIGRWVVEACCRQAAAWREAGLQIPISFNVSPRQFRDPGFVDAVTESIARHGLNPTLFMVEITESTAMRDPTCVEPVLAGLRAAGVRLAIDDFGVGFSSLSRLRDLDVDLLKIDRGFLTHAPADEKAGRLVHAALDLAGALDMTPVAEGVETEQQCRFLQDRGCALVQGFHLSRPLDADAATRLLRERSTGAGAA